MLRVARRASALLCVAFLLLSATSAWAATFTLTPTSLSFGKQVLETTSAVKTVKLTNTAGTPLTFSLAVNNADFTVTSACGGTVNAGANCTISVTFRPSALSARSGKLTVTDTSNSTNRLQVSLSGTGVKETSLSAATLAFGNVVQNTESAAKSVTLTNNQDVPLTGVAVALAGADYKIKTNTCGASLGARKTCTVTLTLTPRVPLGSSDTGTLTFTHNAPTSPQAVNLTGRSVGPISLSSSSQVFPTTAQGGTSTLTTLILRNNQKIQVTNLSLVTAAPFVATGCPTPLAAGATCTLTVKFSPTLAHLGPIAGVLTIRSTNPTVWNRPTASLTGTAIKALALTPSPLGFGNVPVAATSAAKTLTLKNNLKTAVTLGGSPFSISGPAAADYTRTATTCGTSLAAGASCTVTLKIKPSQGGTRAATFTVASTATGSPHTSPLTGTGTTPLTLSATAVAFANTNVRAVSGGRLVTIQNNQNIPVSFSSIAVSGEFAKQDTATTTTTCGATLAATASCAVSLVAKPTVGGARTGTLTIASDAYGSPLSVPLSVTGVNAVTASPLSLTFGNQKILTTSASKQVTLTNHQVVPATVNGRTTGNFAVTDACGGTIPALATCVASVTFTPLTAASLTGTATFNQPGSTTRLSVTLSGTGTTSNPAAKIVNVSPGAGSLGQTLANVTVTGSYTKFTNGTPTVSFGGGITLAGVTVQSDTQLTIATLTIAANATPGARTVQVTNGSATVSLSPGFVVSSDASRTLQGITPAAAAQGQTLNVAIVGTNTNFAQGTTTANFGPGISVNGAVQVSDATHAIANVTVSPTAVPGWRPVTIVTGGEYATLVPAGPSGPGFNVVASSAAIASIAPATGVQGGTPFEVTILGTGTSFQKGVSVVSLGAGIGVGATTVDSPTKVRATISVNAGATPGLRDVTVTTGGEVARKVGAFTVTPSSTLPYLSGVAPTSAQQGQTITLALTGVNTHFTTDTPAPSLEIGGNVAVNSVTVVNDTTIEASVSVALIADAGARTGILSSGSTTYPFSFLVTPSTAAIVGVSPSSAAQGSAVTLSVTGLNTHWDQSTTTAGFVGYPGCPSAYVTRITINSPTSADLDVTVPANACVGPETFVMTTGGEIVSAALGVYRQTPSLALSPGGGMIGTTLTVNFIGEFSHWASGSTSAVIDGTGVTIQDFTVTSPTSATATFVIAPTAPYGSCWSSLPGCHNVTLTTPTGSSSEILTAGFQVMATPAALTSIDPFHLAPGGSALVRIKGSYTHFAAGATTVGFGPQVAVSGVTVVSPTELTVNVAVDAAAEVGWRSAYVNTGDEQLTIAFRIDGPATPSIASVSPSSGLQGETLSNVTITGQFTNFDASSQLILGAGVTVANFTVTSPTSATAVVAISPTAPIGPNAVVVMTGDEVVSGAGFHVLRGPSRILSASPNAATQFQTLNVSLVGEGTHWLQGGSTADFGPGVVVNALTVTDATHATAQVTVLSNAALGFRTVSMQTDGEYVTLDEGLAVQDATPTLLSSSPSSGMQGTTFNVNVLARHTHWQQGVTSASFGDGVTVNAFTVVDSASGVINVTIDPLAFPDLEGSCHALTVTTDTEQVTLANQLCVQAGAAVVTAVNPDTSPQGSTLAVTVTGQNTHFTQGLTTADFGPGINVSNVTVSSPTSATVALAVTTGAANGYRAALMRTLGESASLSYAFVVGQNQPKLNSANPTSGQQGQLLTVRLVGQHTSWAQGTTTVSFGQGITVSGVTVVNATTLDAAIAIDPFASLGSRTLTVTTGGEIVGGDFFSVTASGAIISGVSPSSGNQGQQIRLTVTGLNTHWSQGMTQFSMGGLGQDITLNYLLVDSPTSATASIAIGPTATLGARSIYMVTGGESLVMANAFVVTGGVPAIAGVSPGSARPGDTAVNVQIGGLHTNWDGTTTVDFGPGVAVQTFTVNNGTSITAVVDVHVAAALGARKVTVRTGTQVLEGYFEVVDPAPPTPFVAYMSPSSGLRGQTFTVTIGGYYTHFDPGTSTVAFGDPGTSGITINSFQVVSQTLARANITIGPSAPIQANLVQVVTGSEIVQASFNVVEATPVVSIVDPPSGMQGATLDVNVLGQYTTFDSSTVFDFGSGVTVNGKTVLGPTVAQVNISVGQLATLGGRSVSATTGSEVANSLPWVSFSVTPSLAVTTSVTPNTARQQDTVTVSVVGENTHWDGTTTFSFGGGISVTGKTVTSPTTATLTIAIDALAALGSRSVIATTGGEVASLSNAFIVQAGTPMILSSAPLYGQQQANVTFTILGQVTAWANGETTVSFGSGVAINSVNVTSPTSITVQAAVEWWASGCRTLTVTTGAEALPLSGAFCITPGPAAIASLNPAAGDQGQTLDVIINGVNTHFTTGVTVGSFGPGITVNSLAATSGTTATANITVAANATSGLRSVTLVTQGESASIVNGFTVVNTTPEIQFVDPPSLAQASTATVKVIGSLTSFGPATVFDFGPGVAVTGKTINSATDADVNVTVSPLAAKTLRNVTATTGAEVATGFNKFTVTQGPAYITALSPASGKQNQNGLVVQISGFLTHFTAATPTVDFGPGVTVTSVSVTSDTLMSATVNIAPNAPVQTNTATVTTLGEVATFAAGFTVQTGLPTVSSATPLSAPQGDTLNVVVTGLYTHFVNGTTTASFGAGITVNSVTVTSATQATVNISIDVAAATGSRTVTMTTNAEVATGPGVFTVTGGTPALLSINPATGAQGSTQTVTITGLFTHFQAGVSTVSFSGGGVTTGAVTVNGPTQLQVPVTVTPGAGAGLRTVTVTTGGEAVSLIAAFNVLPGLPAITIISPNVGVPNSTVAVSITGQFTNFVNGTTQATFGAGIGVNGAAAGAFGTIVVTSPTTATATLQIGAAAALGARDVTVQTGVEVLNVNAGFTVQSASPTPPTVTFVSPAHNTTLVPINTAVTLQFSAPLNRTTVSVANVRVIDSVSQGSCGTSYSLTLPGTVDVDASARVVTFTPSAVLSVGRLHYVCVNYGQNGTGNAIKDPSGNEVPYQVYQFTTGFAPDNSGPALIASSIADSATGVGTEAPVILLFSKPVNPATVPAGVSVTTGGSPVGGTVGYTPDYKQVTFTPSGGFAASTGYVVSYTTALEDSVGTPLSNPGTILFTTGPGADSAPPVLVSRTPGSGATVGLTPALRATFNEPLDPTRLRLPGYVYLNNYSFGITLTGTTPVLSADRKTLTLTLPHALDPGTDYAVYMTVGDPGGHFAGYSWVFRTAGSADATAPAVSTVSPPNGATGVAVNAKLQVQLTEALDATFGPTLTLSPSVPVTYSSSDNTALTFTLTSNLAPSTTYTATLTNVRDTSGNAMAPFAWSFTTSASAAADTTNGTITMVPTSGATGVAPTTPIVLTLSKPVSAPGVNATSFYVWDNTIGQLLAGSRSLSGDQRTLTFTPTLAYPAGHQVCAYASYFASLFDWSGNYFSYVASCFTVATGGAGDVTPPQVIAVAPLNGATGIGPANPVTITFSEPLKVSSIGGTNIAVYNGSALVASGPTVAPDGTSATFAITLTYGTTYTVVVGTGVTDLAGNSLPAMFSSTFTTLARPTTTRPQVQAFRPGAGASGVNPATPISFMLSQPIDPATATAGTWISQNGVLLTGATSVTHGNRVVTFTPTAPLAYGALIEAWLTSAASDTFGNQVIDYQTSFTVMPNPATTAPALVSYSPTWGDPGVSRRAVMDVKFSKAVDPATVTSSSFYLKDCSNVLVPSSVSTLNGNTLIRMTPASPLAAGGCYYMYLTTAVKDTGGLSFTGSFPSGVSGGVTYSYFYTSTASDSTAPTVVSVAPVNGASNVAVNAAVRLTFSERVAIGTIDASSVSLSSGGTPIPYTFTTTNNADGTMLLRLAPTVVLPANSLITVSVTAAVTDPSGNAVTPFGASFTTSGTPDFTAPAVISTSVQSGAVGVPLSGVFTLTYDRPMDPRSFVYATSPIYLYDQVLGIYPPATISLSVDLTQVTVAPTSPLAIGRGYTLGSCNATDLAGNVGGCYSWGFTTSVFAPSGGPVVLQTVPYNAMTNVAVNVRPEIKFDRPVSRASFSTVTLTTGGVPVALAPSFTTGDTAVTLAPAAILQPNAAYVLTIAGVTDTAGHPMAGPSVVNFTTGPTIDLVLPALVSRTPPHGVTTARNPVIRLRFAEPVDPIRATGGYLYNNGTGRYVAGFAWSFSADLTLMTMTYPGMLDPYSTYQACPPNIFDVAGNYQYPGCVSFTTGATSDSSAFTVTNVTPPNGAAGVPLKPTVSVQLNKQLDATSVTSTTVTLTPASAGSVQYSSDYRTIGLVLSGNLSPSTAYTVNASGLRDLSGNLLTPFSSTFTTGVAADTANGTVAMTSPAPGSTGVPVTSTITITLSKPVDVVRLANEAFQVFTSAGVRVAGTIAVGGGGTTLTFTPVSPMPAATLMYVYASYYLSLYDLSGNYFFNLSTTFTTASDADTTPPAILSVTPLNGASDVGPYATVTIVFSESVSPATVNGSTFALYNGYANLGAGVGISPDNRTVTLNGFLPYGKTITLVVGTGVRDLSGNALAAPFSSSFTTLPQAFAGSPAVTQMRPAPGATGVPADSVITLFTNSPIDPSSLGSALAVAQNGTPVAGSISVQAGGYAAVFTPSASFAGGSLIHVFLTADARDTAATPFGAFSTSFSVAADTTASPLQLVSATPCHGCGSQPTNTVLDVLFNKAIDPAYANSTYFFMWDSSGNPANLVSATVTQLQPNVLRLTPAVALTDPYYYWRLKSGLRALDGTTLASNYDAYFYTSGTTDTTLPIVTSVSPTNGSTNVGDNATLRFRFNKPVATTTINGGTVTLMNGATPLPYSMSFTTVSGGTAVTLTPQAPLPDNAAITLTLTAGITDLVGHAITAQAVTFQTGSGPDVTAPGLVSRSPDSNQTTSVPTNTRVFTWTFSEPLDPGSVNPSNDWVYRNASGTFLPGTVALSGDGKTITVTLASDLQPNEVFQPCAYYPVDLAGNQYGSGLCLSLTTAAGPAATAPSILATTPVNTQTGAPTNTMIEIVFDKPVDATTFGGMTMTANSIPVPLLATWSSLYGNLAGRVVQLVPYSVLQPNTTYTVTITGVKSLAGVAMGAPYSFSFTTGANPLLTSASYTSATVLVSGVPTALVAAGSVTNVAKDTTIQVTFNSPVSPVSILNGGIRLQVNATSAVVPMTLTMSADGRTATLTPTAPLDPTTQYILGVHYYYAIYTQGGSYVSNGTYFYFTTGS